MPKQQISVSPEMLAFVGGGPVATVPLPHHSLIMHFHLGDVPMLSCGANIEEAEDAAVVLAVASHACRRLFGKVPDDSSAWHLPAELAMLALAIRDCSLPEPARATLRLAKSIELLCATFTHLSAGVLIAAGGTSHMSGRDAARLAAARRLVDERWQEKLTLNDIARACGLNRAKLTRGFREAFGSTVADAIATRRLEGAHQLLIATDLPVSSIGYRCGYSNNASFTRAFARRYGVAPTRMRLIDVAA